MRGQVQNQILVKNPRTGVVDYAFTPPGAEEIAALCSGLRVAQPAWEALGIQGRAEVMKTWADALAARRLALIAGESADTGRLRLAREMVDFVIESVRRWSDRAPEIVSSAARQGRSSTHSHVRFESQLRPYPLVGAISPWNFPFFLATVDAIPALLAGCAVVVKTSEISPRFTDPVMEAIRAVPELERVFAFVKGAGETGQQLIENVDALCFTGSVPTGKRVAQACAGRLIPAFLELGGKDPVVVTANADVERAAQAIVRGAVFATGQICHSIERVYVHQSLYEKLVDRLVGLANEIELAYPDEAQGHIGPFIMDKQAAVIDAQLDDAVARGARILTGGKSERHGGGVYMRATVVVDVTHDMALMTQETFGPVIPVMPYADDDEAVRLANDTEYGLSGAVIAGTEQDALSLGLRIDAGGVTLQDTTLTSAITLDTEKSAFGASGLGESRMGPSAILRFFRKKALILNTGNPVSMTAMREDPPAGRRP